MSTSNNDQSESVSENNNDKKLNKSREENENKLSSELDELIIDKKKLDEQKDKNFDKMLDNIIQKLHPIIETRRNHFQNEREISELNPITSKNQLTQEEIKFLCTKSCFKIFLWRF